MSFVRFPAGGNLWRPPVEDRAAAGEPLLFREHRDLLLDRSPVFLRRVAVEEVVEVRQALRDPTTSINDAALHGLTVADGPGARRRSRGFGPPTRATIAGVSRESEAERPESQTVAPQAVLALAAGDPIETVWRNQLGGLTFRVGAGTGRDRYVKWVAQGTPEIDLPGEADRLMWLAGRAAVPTLLTHGADDEGAWLVTAAMSATSAIERHGSGDRRRRRSAPAFVCCTTRCPRKTARSAGMLRPAWAESRSESPLETAH